MKHSNAKDAKMKLNVAQAAELFGLNYVTVNQYIGRGLVPITRGKREGGRGDNERLVDIRGLLALGIVATLRRKGIPPESISRLTAFFFSSEIAELEASLSAGKTLLVATTDGMLPVRLMGRDELVLNRSGENTLLLAFDLGACRERILTALPQNPAETPAESATV
jgi:hypothetical protein